LGFSPELLVEYTRIPIAFEVRSVYRVEELSPDMPGFRLVEELLAESYIKDYDRYDGPDGAAVNWSRHFDVTRWGFFIAREEGRAVGGAAVAFDTPALHMLEGRTDLAVLWDIRVAPGQRHLGIGTGLFRRAADWAREKGCRLLKIETQNVNVPACRFYTRQGCTLGGINRFHYTGDEADETLLLWYLDLTERS
jgi:GNAT superfamily N-acetyltransferase